MPGRPVAVTLAAYVPRVVDCNPQRAGTVEFADRRNRVVGQVTVRPEDGLTTELRVTFPTKLFTLTSDTCSAWLVDPELKLTGLEVILKSPT